jgi:hypothetical protein
MQWGNYTVKIVVDGVEQEDRPDGVVALPFGCEYVIRIYGSKDGKRAGAKIWLDNICITGEGGLVVPNFGYVDLETPVSDPGHKFRFASVDSAQAHAAGKGGPDDDGTKGLIRMEIYPEKTRPRSTYSVQSSGPEKQYLNRYSGEKISRRCIDSHDFESVGAMSLDSAPASLSSGVTVEGSSSSQRFNQIQMEIESVATTVLIKLRGFAPESVAATTVATAAVNFCSGCGAKLSSLSNLCPSCRRVAR